MKNSYILLRNNIESSSLHIEDLLQIGLLETDLIWVECQSVCWQSPNEVPELKKLLSADKLQPTLKKVDEPVENIPETVYDSPKKANKNKLVFVELPEKNVTASFKGTTPDDMNKYGNPETVNLTKRVIYLNQNPICLLLK